MPKELVLGFDVGGTGLKCGIVNITTGEMETDRLKILTPKPATPAAIAEKLEDFIQFFKWNGLIGCGFPAVVQHGVAKTAANIDPSWIGANIEEVFSKATGLPVVALNDADAAGTAEMAYGVGKNLRGVVLMLTIGTGIGSALFHDGVLVPNSEFGHLIFKGNVAEKYCANSIREQQNMNWKTWGKRLNKFLLHLQRVLTPDAIVLGGGVSKSMSQFQDCLTLDIPVLAAQTQNQAGVIGAAVAAHQIYKNRKYTKNNFQLTQATVG